MSRIRSSNTKPEETVRKYLFSKGFRYRKNDKRYPGKPDIVLPKYRVQVFVHGCFWHQHAGCKYAAIPKTNQDYWLPKLERNLTRDVLVAKSALESGWRVIIVWECAVRGKNKDNALERLAECIVSSEMKDCIAEISGAQEARHVQQ